MCAGWGTAKPGYGCGAYLEIQQEGKQGEKCSYKQQEKKHLNKQWCILSLLASPSCPDERGAACCDPCCQLFNYFPPPFLLLTS